MLINVFMVCVGYVYNWYVLINFDSFQVSSVARVQDYALIRYNDVFNDMIISAFNKSKSKSKSNKLYV